MVVDGEDSPSRPSHRRLVLKTAIILAVLLPFAVLLVSQMPLGGTFAKYRGIETPESVVSLASDVPQLVASRYKGIALRPKITSKAMTEDAGGQRFSGGEADRETEFQSTLLLLQPPFIVLADGFTWGQPKSDFRLDLTLMNAGSVAGITTATRGLDVATVDTRRDLLAGIYAKAFEAIGMPGRYDAEALASQAVVRQSWMGNGIVSAAALLPATAGSKREGSISVDLGQDWQLESIYINTSDTYNYRELAGQ